MTQLIVIGDIHRFKEAKSVANTLKRYLNQKSTVLVEGNEYIKGGIDKKVLRREIDKKVYFRLMDIKFRNNIVKLNGLETPFMEMIKNEISFAIEELKNIIKLEEFLIKLDGINNMNFFIFSNVNFISNLDKYINKLENNPIIKKYLTKNFWINLFEDMRNTKTGLVNPLIIEGEIKLIEILKTEILETKKEEFKKRIVSKLGNALMAEYMGKKMMQNTYTAFSFINFIDKNNKQIIMDLRSTIAAGIILEELKICTTPNLIAIIGKGHLPKIEELLKVYL